MAISSLSISPTLSAAVTPSNVSIVDNTDYAAAGYTSPNYIVNGYIKLEFVGATGTSVVYDNTSAQYGSPDVQPLSSTSSLLPIPLPLDADGKVMPGSYIFTYRAAVVDAGLSLVDDFSQSFSFDVDFTIPVACLADSVNCQDSKITSYDNTLYGVYASLTRVHTLMPPPPSGSANIVGSTQAITTSLDIWTGTWYQSIAATVSYEFTGDGTLTLIVLVEGSRKFDVVCNTGLSVINCCLKKTTNKWWALRMRNDVAYNNMWQDVIKPMLVWSDRYSQALTAGDENGAAAAYAKIIEVTGCDEAGCGCDDGTPQQVIPAGSSASFVVDSPDNSIAVTATVSGNQTTFHVQVSAGLQLLIASFYNRTITTGTPSYLQLTETGTGSNRNTQIDFLPAALIAGVFPFIEARFEISAPGAGSNVAGITLNSINQAGNMFAPAVAQGYLFGLSPNTNTDIAVITFYNFIADAAALDFTATACVMSENTARNILKDIEAEVWNFDPTSVTGVCDVRIYNPSTGLAYTIGDVLAKIGTGTLYIKLNITAKPR